MDGGTIVEKAKFYLTLTMSDIVALGAWVFGLLLMLRGEGAWFFGWSRLSGQTILAAGVLSGLYAAFRYARWQWGWRGSQLLRSPWCTGAIIGSIAVVLALVAMKLTGALTQSLEVPWGKIWWLIVSIPITVALQLFCRRTLRPPVAPPLGEEWYRQLETVLCHQLWWPKLEASEACAQARREAGAEGVDPQSCFGAPHLYAREVTRTQGQAAVRRHARFQFGGWSVFALVIFVATLQMASEGEWVLALVFGVGSIAMAFAARRVFREMRRAASASD